MPLEAGEGVSDLTPPPGVELASLHKPLGKERHTTGVRQPCSVRALALRVGKTEAAIAVMDLLGLSQEFARKSKKRIAKKTGNPEKNIRICATHSHSAPSLVFLRQWGALAPQFEKLAEERTLEAVAAAEKDLAPAGLYFCEDRVQGGHHKRATQTRENATELT